MRESVTFGEMLRRYRLGAGFTQEDLARQAGLSLRGLSDLERGARRYPRAETVRRLATALRLPDADRDALMLVRRRPVTVALADARPARPRTNLPVPLTSFIGWTRERAEVR